jgi:hypothetical protein
MCARVWPDGSARQSIQTSHQSQAIERIDRRKMNTKKQTNSFPEVTYEHANWIKQVHSDIRGVRLGFSFTFHTSYLRKILNPTMIAERTRAQPAASARSLVLFDTVMLGQQRIDVELWAQYFKKSPQVQLEVFLTSPTPLPQPLRVTLKWNSGQASSLIQVEQTVFQIIHMANLEQDSDIHIEFETETSRASVNGVPPQA